MALKTVLLYRTGRAMLPVLFFGRQLAGVCCWLAGVCCWLAGDCKRRYGGAIGM